MKVTKYKSDLSISQIEALTQTVSARRLLYPTNKLIFVRMKEGTIVLKSVLFISKMKISENENETIIELHTSYRVAIVTTFIFIVLFLLAFFFVDNVTINGIPNPRFPERCAFVIVPAALVSIATFCIAKLRSDFVKTLEKEFALNKRSQQ